LLSDGDSPSLTRASLYLHPVLDDQISEGSEEAAANNMEDRMLKYGSTVHSWYQRVV